MNEVIKAANIHKESIESNTSLNSQIKRAIKGMSDALTQKRLRMVTANTKASKMFDLLYSMNLEVSSYIQKYANQRNQKS